MLSQKLFLVMEIFTFGPQLLYQLFCFAWLGFGVRVFSLLICSQKQTRFQLGYIIHITTHSCCSSYYYYHYYLKLITLLTTLSSMMSKTSTVKELCSYSALQDLSCQIPTKNSPCYIILTIILTLPVLSQSHCGTVGKQH